MMHINFTLLPHTVSDADVGTKNLKQEALSRAVL